MSLLDHRKLCRSLRVRRLPLKAPWISPYLPLAQYLLAINGTYAGQPIAEATRSSLHLGPLKASDAGTYSVIVSNSFGSVTSSPAILTVMQVLARPSKVVAWGYNAFGELNVPQDLTNAVSVASGRFHSLALRDDGTVVAWGTNENGATTVPAKLYNVRAVAGGADFSLALRSDGTVAAWGTNNQGIIEWATNLTEIGAIAAGQFTALALRNNGTVSAAGYNPYGGATVPPGLSNVAAIACGFTHSLALLSNGIVVAWGAGFTNSGVDPNYGQSMVPEGLSNVVAIVAGGTASLALKRDGTVVVWGSNNSGQLNVPTSATNVVAISGYQCFMAQKTDGTLVAWGSNNYGQTNIPPDLKEVVAIGCNGRHNLAVVNLTEVGTIILVHDSGFGFRAGQFGFNLSGPAGQTVVVDASTNLLNWSPVSTNNMGNEPVYFSDPESSWLLRHFYRVRLLP